MPLPLFLTYSDRLTNRALEVVKSILVSHASYLEKSQNYLTNDNLTQLNECFQPFQAFLLQQLPVSLSERFHSNKYVSLHRFKKLFARSFHNDRHSAEICWYAIRTYIKGFDFADEDQDFLEVEEYRTEIPQAYKSIDDNDFQDIYNRIWRWYRELQQSHGYWDDQDLVREVKWYCSSKGHPHRESYYIRATPDCPWWCALYTTLRSRRGIRVFA